MDNLINQLKQYGLDDTKISTLIMLGYQDFLDEVEEDLLEASDKDLEKLDEKIDQIDTTNIPAEELSKTVMDLFKDIYGLQAQNKLNTFMMEYLQDAVNSAEEMKNIFLKAQAGDPETLEKLNQAMQSEDIGNMKTAIDSVNQL